ncbi:MAG: DUF1259 domain-containing protein [Acidobacteriaceae bacterium]|nr:DUF1259 domain-containing protein [Acidobacteriaceae bacterium]
MQIRRDALFVFVALLISLCTSSPAQQGPADWKGVEDALGRKGSMQPGDVYRFSMPRSDLNVSVQGIPIKAGLALGSWAAFKQAGHGAIVMGDLVLTEPEVGPVIAALQQGGIEQTAVHNHLLNESPRIVYVHIDGSGDAAKLASALKAALAVTKTPPAVAASAQLPSIAFDTAQVDQALGRTGKNNNGIYQFSVPRAESVRDMDMEIPPAMGTATVINFQPTGDGRAAITGDFVLRAKEVNPVIRALTANGIAVTAIHSHMLTEEPRLFFMHFWANDDPVKLARGLRAALDETNSAPASK